MTDTALANTPEAFKNGDLVDETRMPAGAVIVHAKKKIPATVWLEGRAYRALPPKALVGIALAKKMEAAGEDVEKILTELESWLISIFGKTQAPAIMTRLGDGDDDLDLPDVIELLSKIAEKATGNPPT